VITRGRVQGSKSLSCTDKTDKLATAQAHRNGVRQKPDYQQIPART